MQSNIQLVQDNVQKAITKIAKQIYTLDKIELVLSLIDKVSIRGIFFAHLYI